MSAQVETISPGLALIGMILMTADDQAMDSVGILMPRLVGLPAGALTGLEGAAMDAVRTALDSGMPPTVTNLRALEPSLTGTFFAEAKRAARAPDGFNSIPVAVKAITKRYHVRTLAEAISAAYGRLQADDLDGATELLSEVDLGQMRGAPERLRDYQDHDIDKSEGERPFQLSHTTLNRVLGGGLGAGGPLGLSLWVAPSGHGKSSFWWGETPNQLRQGNWVLLCAAEAPADYVFHQITRLNAGMTEASYTVAHRRKRPVMQEKATRSRDEIRGYARRGQLQVWDEPFDPAKIRELAETKIAEMRMAGATGRLIIIVDNYDALFENLGDVAGPQAVNQQMQRLQRHTREKEYHIALLAQASSDAETMLGPCGQGDVYGNRKLAMKVAHMVTMYRPKSAEAKQMVDKVTGEPHVGSRTWLAVRKKRGPGEEDRLIEMETGSVIGAWIEKGANSLPF